MYRHTHLGLGPTAGFPGYLFDHRHREPTDRIECPPMGGRLAFGETRGPPDVIEAKKTVAIHVDDAPTNDRKCGGISHGDDKPVLLGEGTHERLKISPEKHKTRTLGSRNFGRY